MVLSVIFSQFRQDLFRSSASRHDMPTGHKFFEHRAAQSTRYAGDHNNLLVAHILTNPTESAFAAKFGPAARTGLTQPILQPSAAAAANEGGRFSPAQKDQHAANEQAPWKEEEHRNEAAHFHGNADAVGLAPRSNCRNAGEPAGKPNGLATIGATRIQPGIVPGIRNNVSAKAAAAG